VGSPVPASDVDATALKARMEDEERVIDYIKKHGGINQFGLRLVCHSDVDTAKQLMKDLVRRGVLQENKIFFGWLGWTLRSPR
jgi:hypothetical protein